MTVAQLPLSFENAAFIGWVALNRIRIQLSGNTHPYDGRFISGDAFRSLADHVCEDLDGFDPSLIEENDLVFVQATLIRAYFESIHPKISVRYRLITHNGDTNIDETFRKYIDSGIRVWWAQNCLLSHPKVHPIPIGLENMSYYNHGIPQLFSRPQRKSKKPRILYGFSVSTNRKIRQSALATLLKIKIADPVPGRLNSSQYIQHLDGYQFVASPPGNGSDCHRAWEALYRGVIPIVQKSTFTDMFRKLKLPIWVIADWNDLQKYSEEALEAKYKSIMNKSTTRPLYLKYWRNSIVRKHI